MQRWLRYHKSPGIVKQKAKKLRQIQSNREKVDKSISPCEHKIFFFTDVGGKTCDNLFSLEFSKEGIQDNVTPVNLE